MQKKGENIAYKQSRQRIRILELLRSTTEHPTADWLYTRLKKEFPRLSLGTVYRNLSILNDQGLIKKIHYGSTFDRFEANITPHHHLICEECGAIIDFIMPNYDEIIDSAGKLTDFTVRSHKIEFFGICTNCKQKSIAQK